MTLGNRIFPDIISQGSQGALNPVTGVCVRKEDTQKQREGGDVKVEAETSVMCLQANP